MITSLSIVYTTTTVGLLLVQQIINEELETPLLNTWYMIAPGP